MGKFLVRVTIVLTSLYFVLSFLMAQFLGVDIATPYYIILFESCVVVYAFSEGRYHCKYIKYTALSVLFADIVTQMDNALDFLSITAHNIIPIAIIATGIFIGIGLAIRHYFIVLKLKRRRHA